MHKHYHILIGSLFVKADPIVIRSWNSSFFECQRAQKVIEEMTGLKVVRWNEEKAVFSDGTTVEMQECLKEECLKDDRIILYDSKLEIQKREENE